MALAAVTNASHTFEHRSALTAMVAVKAGMQAGATAGVQRCTALQKKGTTTSSWPALNAICWQAFGDEQRPLSHCRCVLLGYLEVPRHACHGLTGCKKHLWHLASCQCGADSSDHHRTVLLFETAKWRAPHSYLTQLLQLLAHSEAYLCANALTGERDAGHSLQDSESVFGWHAG